MLELLLLNTISSVIHKQQPSFQVLSNDLHILRKMRKKEGIVKAWDLENETFACSCNW